MKMKKNRNGFSSFCFPIQRQEETEKRTLLGKKGQIKTGLFSLFGSKSTSETEIFKLEEISEESSVVLTYMGESPVTFNKKASHKPFSFHFFGRNFELSFYETFIDGFIVVAKEATNPNSPTTVATLNSKKELNFSFSVSDRFCIQVGLSFLFFGMLC